jgi:hypothetical protein
MFMSDLCCQTRLLRLPVGFGYHGWIEIHPDDMPRGPTKCASEIVSVPGPQPTSSSVCPASMCICS